MKKSLSGWLPVLTFIFAGCSVMKVSQRDPADIKDLYLVHPVSEIEYVTKGNRMQYSRNFSDSCTRIMAVELPVLLPDRNVRHMEYDIDTTRMLEQEVARLFQYIGDRKEIANLCINRTIDEILASRNIDYAMFLWATGYTRTNSNFAGQIALGVAVAIISVGSVYYAPVKSVVNLKVIIIDRQNKNIAMYNHQYLQNYDPLKPRDMRIALKNLTHRYFYKNR